MSTYGIGTVVRLTTEVRNSSGTLVTPAAITITIRLPDATIVGPFTPTSDGTGLYHYDYTPVQAGRHIVRWTTTTPTVVDEEPFDVAAMWSEAGIISVDDAKTHLKLLSDDDREELAEFVRATNEIVERHAGTVLPLVCTERLRGGSPSLLLGHRPVISVTSVTLAGGSLLAASGYELVAEAGVILRMVGDYESCWEGGRITVVYTAGRAVIPAAVLQAARVIVRHLWETQRGRMGGARAAGSDEVWDPRWGYAIPRRALELMGDAPMGIA